MRRDRIEWLEWCGVNGVLTKPHAFFVNAGVRDERTLCMNRPNVRAIPCRADPSLDRCGSCDDVLRRRGASDRSVRAHAVDPLTFYDPRHTFTQWTSGAA